MKYLCAKSLAHVLTNAAIVAHRIRTPIDAVDAAPRNNNGRLFAKFARLVFLVAHATTDIPDLLRFDLAALIIQSAPASGVFAHLHFEVRDYTVIVLAQSLALDVSHLRHHGLSRGELGTLGWALFEGWRIGVAHRYIGALESDRRRGYGGADIADGRCGNSCALIYCVVCRSFSRWRWWRWVGG
jgi:hypothetical protein